MPRACVALHLAAATFSAVPRVARRSPLVMAAVALASASSSAPPLAPRRLRLTRAAVGADDVIEVAAVTDDSADETGAARAAARRGDARRAGPPISPSRPETSRLIEGAGLSPAPPAAACPSRQIRARRAARRPARRPVGALQRAQSDLVVAQESTQSNSSSQSVFSLASARRPGVHAANFAMHDPLLARLTTLPCTACASAP